MFHSRIRLRINVDDNDSITGYHEQCFAIRFVQTASDIFGHEFLFMLVTSVSYATTRLSVILQFSDRV